MVLKSNNQIKCNLDVLRANPFRSPQASLLGMNSAQIRAALDPFPRISPTARPKSRTGADPGQEASVGGCFRLMSLQCTVPDSDQECAELGFL